MIVRLDISKIVFGSFMMPWWNWRVFVRALAIPLTVLTALIQGWHYTWEQLPWWANWLVWMAYGIAFVLCVVTCHRLVLLDAKLLGSRLFPKWTWRETRFYLWMMAVLLICAAVGYVVLTMVFAVSRHLVDATNVTLFSGIQFAVKFLLLYFFARISLIFPATAVDRKVNLKWAWQLTKGNGWRLVLIVAFLPWLFSQTITLVYRTEASAFETLVLTVLTSALFIVEVAALSLSYRELTKMAGG